MNQLNFSTNVTPPQRNFAEIPIISTLKGTYLMWHNYFQHLPRLTRYTLGAKIDNLFIELLEMTLAAQFEKRENKPKILKDMSHKLDALKFFITLLWEAKGLTANKYAQLSQNLISAGNMVGKWLASLKKTTPPAETEGE